MTQRKMAEEKKGETERETAGGGKEERERDQWCGFKEIRRTEMKGRSQGNQRRV